VLHRSNRRRYYLDEIERIVIGGLREELGTREAAAYFVECYNAERRRTATGNLAGRRTIEDELAEVERKISRAVAAIIDGRITREEAEAHFAGAASGVGGTVGYDREAASDHHSAAGCGRFLPPRPRAIG
jgi:hypothetical protein